MRCGFASKGDGLDERPPGVSHGIPDRTPPTNCLEELDPPAPAIFDLLGRDEGGGHERRSPRVGLLDSSCRPARGQAGLVVRPLSEVPVGASSGQDLGNRDHPLLVVAPEDRPPVADAQAVEADRADEAADVSLWQPAEGGEDAFPVRPAETGERLKRGRAQLDAPARVAQASSSLAACSSETLEPGSSSAASTAARSSWA